MSFHVLPFQSKRNFFHYKPTAGPIFQNSFLCGSGVGCADAYRTAEAQQAAQPLSGPARQLACNMIWQFFSQPLLDGKPKLQLVVNNDQML